MIELPWHHHLFELHQGRQRHHGVSAPANKNFLYVHGCVAVLGFGLHHHIVLLTTTLVLGNAAPAHGGFHRTSNNINRNTQVGRTLAVYLQADLGLVQTQVHIHADNAWVFSDFILNGLGDFGQVFIAVIGQHHEVERSLAKSLAQRRRGDGKGHHTRHAAHGGHHFTRHVQGAAFTLIPRQST